jgi:peptidoglycan/xylan/chitin deacetylase (PgdA/CDA1 family)
MDEPDNPKDSPRVTTAGEETPQTLVGRGCAVIVRDEGRTLLGVVAAFFLLSAIILPSQQPEGTARAQPRQGATASLGPAASGPSGPTGSAALPIPGPSSGSADGIPARTPDEEPATPAPCPAPASAPVFKAPGSSRTVALTFDDGPSSYTPGLLDLLRRENVVASFFVIGGNVGSREETVARAVREGHLVGDHTWHHRYPESVRGGWTRSYLQREIRTTQQAITSATGAFVCWFRPPGGMVSPAVLRVTRELRLSVALWSVDTLDWRYQNGNEPSDRVARRIATRAASGLAQEHPVILLHDGGGRRPALLAAVSSIIDQYRAHGYRFVRLDEQAATGTEQASPGSSP